MQLRSGMIAVGVLVLGIASQADARHLSLASLSPDQTALTAGGGMSDFVGSTMRDNARVGANWDARLIFGTRSVLAFEGGYSGTYNLVTTDRSLSGSSTGPYLTQQSVDGALRINLLPWYVEPYIFGGVGYNHASLHNRDQNPELALRFRRDDDQLLVPAGGGLAAYFGDRSHLTLDARFTYRAVFFDDLLRTEPNARQDSYTVAGRIGYVF